MKTTVNFYLFRDAFSCRPDNFTYEGLSILFDHLTAYEDDTGEELELDPIAFCCEYAESTYSDIARDYDIDLSDCETDEDRQQAIINYLNDKTTICGELEDGQTIVFQQF